MEKATLDELIAAYRDAALTQGEATESGDYKAGNKASELLTAIYAELHRRGDEAQRALLPLLDDAAPGVRLWSASHTLEFAP